MGGKIVAIFVIIIVLGVGLYVLNSGVLTKGATGLSSLFPGSSSSSSSGSSSGSGLSGLFGLGNANNPQNLPGYPSSTIGAPSAGTPGTNPKNIPAGFTAAELSPYFQKMNISGSSGANGQISLFASLPANESVDITGWQIRTNRGGEFIPQVVIVYSPVGVSAESDITVKNGDVVTIYSNSSPANLRVNKCVGYLNTVNQFNPPLPQSCPYINRSEVQSFTGACQNYIFSLGSCQQANLGDPRIPQNDPACQSYIQNHFSYKSCLDQHEGDKDFFSNQVLVWAGGNPLDPFHDRVMLLDRNGLLVNLFSY